MICCWTALLSFGRKGTLSVVNKTGLLNLLSACLAIIAVCGTVLGGAVLAFDKSLWPVDGYVLYVGHIAHLLVIPTSAIALAKGRTANPKTRVIWLVTQGIILALALVAVVLTYQGMFNYGWWPS
jgi:hypothetical protein